jgi:hypothetical protein
MTILRPAVFDRFELRESVERDPPNLTCDHPATGPGAVTERFKLPAWGNVIDL